jgi:hypothetical protein
MSETGAAPFGSTVTFTGAGASSVVTGVSANTSLTLSVNTTATNSQLQDVALAGVVLEPIGFSAPANDQPLVNLSAGALYRETSVRLNFARCLDYTRTPVELTGAHYTGRLRVMNNADSVHAANAIKFINGQKALGLKHILMGNEPFLEDEVHGVEIPTADEYIAKYIQYALALREAQESITGNPNDIQLWGPELATGWTGWQTTHPHDCTENYNIPGGYSCSYGGGKFTEFIPYFLSRLAAAEHDQTVNPKGYKLLDVLTWHYYPLFRTRFADKDSVIKTPNGQQNVAGMLESINLWNDVTYVNKYDAASPKGITPKIVQRFQGWRNQYYPSALIAVTEFGIDSVLNINYHPIVRPLYLADLIGRIGSEGVDTFVNSFLQGSRGNDLCWVV